MTCPQVWKTGMFSDLTVKPTKTPDLIAPAAFIRRLAAILILWSH